MRINNLELRSYRNHKNFKIKFEKDLMLILGPNGSGKTNILEAAHLLSIGKSTRASYDKDLISYEQDFSTIKANVLAQKDKFDIEVQIISKGDNSNISIKKGKINNVSKSIQYTTSIFTSVLFSPLDINLLIGSPSNRRRYVDSVISQVDINYKRAVSNYTKAVRQRNKVLEKMFERRGGEKEIDFWNQQILEHGILIQKTRERFFEDIKDSLQEYGHRLNKNHTTIEIDYDQCKLTEKKLEDIKEREIGARTTLLGPHRDDFGCFFNKRNVSDFGSRGQQRSTVLSLKLSEIDFIESKKEERPVLLLDDVFSEFDELHQQAVMETIGRQQTIITSAEDIDFIHENGFEILKL